MTLDALGGSLHYLQRSIGSRVDKRGRRSTENRHKNVRAEALTQVVEKVTLQII